jgi:hypothetical protein
MYICAMKVLSNDNFSVYVYSDHPPPHCHIKYCDGTVIRISLLLLTSLDEVTISRDLRDYLLDNLDKLTEKWDQYNSKRAKALRHKAKHLLKKTK